MARSAQRRSPRKEARQVGKIGRPPGGRPQVRSAPPSGLPKSLAPLGSGGALTALHDRTNTRRPARGAEVCPGEGGIAAPPFLMLAPALTSSPASSWCRCPHVIGSLFSFGSPRRPGFCRPRQLRDRERSGVLAVARNLIIVFGRSNPDRIWRSWPILDRAFGAARPSSARSSSRRWSSHRLPSA